VNCVRHRLARRVRAAARRRVVLLHGSAGCGKSVALAQYLAEVRSPHAVFAVRHEHGRVAAFARGLAEAFDPVAPGTARSLGSAYSSARRSGRGWDAVAGWLAGQLRGPATVAVDQLHRLGDDPATHAFLSKVVEASAPDIRWLIATRSTAALPLPRWLAAGLADASIDEETLGVESRDVLEIATALGTSPAFVESLRLLHDGSIGAIVDGVSGADAAWRRLTRCTDVLIALAALPELDAAILNGLDAEARRLLAEIEIAIPFAGPAAEGPRAIDESIRTRAYALAERDDPAAIARGRIAAARTLEAAGRFATALGLYVAAAAGDDVLRMLDRHGFDLQEGGYADVVVDAIASVPPEARRRSYVALALEATDESYRGRYDVSEAWFEHALRLAPDEQQRVRIDIAFAVELLRRGRADAFERLARLATVATDRAHAVSILGSLATAHATAGRLAEAQRCIDDALAGLPLVTDVAIRATVHQRAAFVALTAGNAGEAARQADVAAALAREHGNDDLVAVARSVTYVVAFSFDDDPGRALSALNEIGAAAQRLGNGLFRRFALIGRYLIAAERCDRAELQELDSHLAGEELEASLKHAEEGLLPARALRLSWSGDFAGAHAVVEYSAQRQPAAEMRALRWAEIAVYAAGARRLSEASGAIESARAELETLGAARSVESVRARLLAALASTIVRRTSVARILLNEVKPDLARWPRWGTLHAVLQTMAVRDDSGRHAERMLDLLEEMRAAGLGGWAGLIEQLPAGEPAGFAVQP